VKLYESAVRKLIREELNTLLYEDSHVASETQDLPVEDLPVDGTTFTSSPGGRQWSMHVDSTGVHGWTRDNGEGMLIVYNNDTVFLCDGDCDDSNNWSYSAEASENAADLGIFNVITQNFYTHREAPPQEPPVPSEETSTTALDIPDDELEGRPGRWKYKVHSIPPTISDLESVEASDIQDVIMKVESDTAEQPVAVGNTFRLGDISQSEDYEGHPLVKDVVDAINALLGES
jgi:hypothetical protein